MMSFNYYFFYKLQNKIDKDEFTWVSIYFSSHFKPIAFKTFTWKMGKELTLTDIYHCKPGVSFTRLIGCFGVSYNRCCIAIIVELHCLTKNSLSITPLTSIIHMTLTAIIICDLFVYENFAGIKISRVFFKMPCPTPFYML